MNDESKNQNLPEPDPQSELVQKLGEVEKQRDEYLAGWQRAKADLINYKKEEMQRLQEMARFGMEDIIHDFLGVLDSFDLGLAALEKQGPVEKGIYLIRAQIEDVLRQRGLQKIEVKVGDQFNPSSMEALSEVQSDKPGGAVVEVVSQGYRLHEKIVRPAKVTISKIQN